MKIRNRSKWILAGCLPLLMSCARCDQAFKGCDSEIHGLYRTIIVYDYDGDVIAEWETKSTVDYGPTDAAFLNAFGKRVHIMGGIVVDQEK